jgi:hypothetical protein
MHNYILLNETLNKELTKHDNLSTAIDNLEHMQSTLPEYKYGIYKETIVTKLKKLKV